LKAAIDLHNEGKWAPAEPIDDESDGSESGEVFEMPEDEENDHDSDWEDVTG
jgi:hypothetical protein